MNRPVVFALCLSAAGGPLAVGAAQPSGAAITSIAIDDSWLGMPGQKHEERYEIVPAGKGYVRLTRGPHPETQQLAPGVVDNFVTVVALWRYPRPTPRSLGLSEIQNRTLLGYVQAKCGYSGDLSSALWGYYEMKTIWYDDYPDVEVVISYPGGQKTQIYSQNQQIFGLPWRTVIAHGRERLSFDAEISRALVPLLGSSALNVDRFYGYAPNGTGDPLDEVASAACTLQEKKPE